MVPAAVEVQAVPTIGDADAMHAFLVLRADKLRARIPAPHDIRAGERRADGQIRNLTLSTRGGALQSGVDFARRLTSSAISAT